VAAKNREKRKRAVVLGKTKRTVPFSNAHDRVSDLSPNTGYRELAELQTAARHEIPRPYQLPAAAVLSSPHYLGSAMNSSGSKTGVLITNKGKLAFRAKNPVSSGFAEL